MFLVGMEESGETRRALRALGIDAWSCDLQRAADDSPFHIQDDVFTVTRSRAWKRAIMHPVCRYLTHAGIKHLFKNHGSMPLMPDEERWHNMVQAAAFFKRLLDLPFPVVCENPRMHPYGLFVLQVWPFCSTQPHLHGDEAFKETLFWRNDESFQPLTATKPLPVPAYGTDEYKRWSKVFRMAPGPNRERDRSKTYPGLAQAMATQWGHI